MKSQKNMDLERRSLVIIVGLDNMCKGQQVQLLKKGPYKKITCWGQRHENYGKRYGNQHPTSERSDLTILFQVPNIST